MDVQAFKKLLIESEYPEMEIECLVDGFQDGFDLGYRGMEKVRHRAPNLKLRVGNELILWNKIMKEARKSRYTGPFEDIPFEYYILSPVD